MAELRIVKKKKERKSKVHVMDQENLKRFVNVGAERWSFCGIELQNAEGGKTGIRYVQKHVAKKREAMKDDCKNCWKAVRGG